MISYASFCVGKPHVFTSFMVGNPRGWRPLIPFKPVATVWTTKFNIRKFHVVPTKWISVLYMVLRLCISLYSINRLVYSTDTVYLLRGTNCILEYDSSYSMSVHVWFCSGQCGTGTVFFFPSTSIFHCQYHSTDVAVTGTNGRSPGTFQKAMFFRNTGALDRKLLSFIFKRGVVVIYRWSCPCAVEWGSRGIAACILTLSAGWGGEWSPSLPIRLTTG